MTTPETLYVSADRTYIDVRLTYKCKNTKLVRYYLTGEVSQYSVPETSYSIGVRGETGIVSAKCNGGRVTQTLRFMRNWFGGLEGTPQLKSGSADFRFHLDARAATGAGWYQDENPDSVAQRRVTLVTS